MRGFSAGSVDDDFSDQARLVVMSTLESSSDEERGDYGMIKEDPQD